MSTGCHCPRLRCYCRQSLAASSCKYFIYELLVTVDFFFFHLLCCWSSCDSELHCCWSLHDTTIINNHQESKQNSLIQINCRYILAEKHRYNARSISTLGAESFYSDISSVDVSGSSCPKAHKIPKLMGVILEYNQAKHDPTKIFAMDRRRGTPYPSRPSDMPGDSSESDHEGDSAQFKSHKFDRIPRKINKRKKFRPTISGKCHHHIIK